MSLIPFSVLSGVIVLAWLSWRNCLGSVFLSYSFGVVFGAALGVASFCPRPHPVNRRRRLLCVVSPTTLGLIPFPRTHFSPATQTNAGEREGKGNRKCIALPGEILYYSPCSPDLPGLWETYERLKRCPAITQVAVCKLCVFVINVFGIVTSLLDPLDSLLIRILVLIFEIIYSEAFCVIWISFGDV